MRITNRHQSSRILTNEFKKIRGDSCEFVWIRDPPLFRKRHNEPLDILTRIPQSRFGSSIDFRKKIYRASIPFPPKRLRRLDDLRQAILVLPCDLLRAAAGQDQPD